MHSSVCITCFLLIYKDMFLEIWTMVNSWVDGSLMQYIYKVPQSQLVTTNTTRHRSFSTFLNFALNMAIPWLNLKYWKLLGFVGTAKSCLDFEHLSWWSCIACCPSHSASPSSNRLSLVYWQLILHFAFDIFFFCPASPSINSLCCKVLHLLVALAFVLL